MTSLIATAVGLLFFIELREMTHISNTCQYFFVIKFLLLFQTLLNPLDPDGSYMIHESYGRNNCPEAKGFVDNTNFLFT